MFLVVSGGKKKKSALDLRTTSEHLNPQVTDIKCNTGGGFKYKE